MDFAGAANEAAPTGRRPIVQPPRPNSWLSHERYPRLLFALLVVFAGLLAIAPHDRADWLLENALLFAGVGVLVATRRKLPLSRVSYTLIFVFLCLHSIGAHYTYSLVPYDAVVRRRSPAARCRA